MTLQLKLASKMVGISHKKKLKSRQLIGKIINTITIMKNAMLLLLKRIKKHYYKIVLTNDLMIKEQTLLIIKELEYRTSL